MTIMTKKNRKRFYRGQMSLQILIFGGVAVLFLAGFLVWLDNTSKSILRISDRNQALTIAEAGIEYYRWHLAHAPQDYTDGTGGPGPYTHTYYDKNGQAIGQFILDITPPPAGSTVVTIKSTGKVFSDPTVEKAVRVKMGIPSFAKYTVVSAARIWFGSGGEVFGPVHSNNGIRFDAKGHNLITSALNDYDDNSHSGGNEFGVHTHVNPPPGSGVNNSFRPDEAPPNPVQNRTDVFLAGRQFPVPAVDFAGITQDLSQMKADAQNGGFYAGPSGAAGYEVALKTDRTFDLYRVTSLVTPPSGCNNLYNQSGWGTWSIQNKTFLSNNPIPANGIIFIEDHVWVRGQINGSRVTVASARFPDNPSTRSNIIVTNSIRYTNYDGTDVISLIAQNHVLLGMVSDDTLNIDGAIMAQNGALFRYYYRKPDFFSQRCSPYHIRNVFNNFGMIGSYLQAGTGYSDGTGYQEGTLTYDGNLLYSPPPSFPLTSDSYQTLSWEEIK